MSYARSGSYERLTVRTLAVNCVADGEIVGS
jgi:hypothetical protein